MPCPQATPAMYQVCLARRQRQQCIRYAVPAGDSGKRAPVPSTSHCRAARGTVVSTPLRVIGGCIDMPHSCEHVTDAVRHLPAMKMGEGVG